MSADDARAEGLLVANTEFYAAFEQMDVAAMRAAWASGAETLCIHPGWPACRGAEAVEESWRRIFANTSYIEFTITVLEHGIGGDHGWVVCEEGILQSTPQGMTRSVVLSTNMFVDRDGRWQMTLHHGSPVVQRLVADGE